MGPGHHHSTDATMAGIARGTVGAGDLAVSADGRSRISDDNRYPGGKGCDGTYQWILGKLPTHVFYAEPFVGKGAIYRHKPPALRSYLVDADPRVVRWWKVRGCPGAIVHCGDGIRWLELAAQWAGPDVLVYLDPPYMLETRAKKQVYVRELSNADHGRLLYAARKCRCRVVISGYQSRLYDLALNAWHRFEREVVTRGGTLATEVLWTNYHPGTVPSALAMEYSALGNNFRERERVSRKIRRWVSRYRAMPAAERRAMLLALVDSELRSCTATPGGAAGGRRRSSSAAMGSGSPATAMVASK